MAPVSTDDRTPTEVVLAGGGVTVVTRVGSTVRRPVRPWTDAVHVLLRHLGDSGFDGAPRALGVDEQGREILDHLDGEVGHYPLSAQVRSDTALVSAGRLLRRYHDATVDLAARATTGWQLPPLHPVEVVCHGDVAPYNCVFRDARAVGLIDFDTARPGPRSWDLAYAVYRFAPVTDPANGDGFGTPAEQARRARRFLDAYGADQELRTRTVEALGPRLRELVSVMRAAAAAGDERFAGHVAQGHADLYLRDIAYLEAQRPTWDGVVVAT